MRNRRRSRRLPPIAVVTAALAACAAGCDESARTSAPAGSAPSANSSPTDASPASAPVAYRETWEAHFLDGAKVGYVHAAYFHEPNDVGPTVRIESEGKISLLRDGRRIEQSMRERFWETSAGDVLRFENTVLMGAVPQTTVGTIAGEQAVLVWETAGKKTTQTIAWPKGTRGPSGLTDDFLRRPPQPGETRTMAAFLPVFNRVVRITAKVGGLEAVELGKVRRELLRVDAEAALEGTPPFAIRIWLDERGEALKSEYPALKMTTIRTTEALAKAAGDVLPPDLGTSTMVRIAPPLERAHATRRVRYRVVLDGGDAATVFPSGAGQNVRRLDDGAAEITVTALRPGVASPTGTADSPPTDADNSPGALIQSDDPLVVKLAADAVGGETDPWRIATRLEALVRDHIRPSPLDAAFATAAETARTHTGDCTEHAVLLAALLRARGIPARTAIGLVYVEGRNAFGYHMWTEAYVGARWLPLDATLGGGGTSAAYLKVADSHLAGVDSLTVTLPVVQLLGRLHVDVIEARYQ